VDPGAKARESVLDESNRAAEVEDSIDNLYDALGGKVNDLNLHLNQQMVKFQAKE
jgi:hypothetical protein